MMSNMNDPKENLSLTVEAPYSLNYLIFMQNIFLNNTKTEGEDNNRSFPFPYFDSSNWGVLKEEKFESKFKEIWSEISYKNEQGGYDHNGILEQDSRIYKQLFSNNIDGEHGFPKSVKLFLSWWESFYGKIAIERLFESENGQEVYFDFSNAINSNNYIITTKRFKINLIYDKQLLVDTTSTSSHFVLPIEDLFMNRNKIAYNLLKNFKRST